MNKPSVWFNVENEEIIFGMAAIKNVGIGAVEELEKSREKLGRDFTTIFDLCSNVDTRVVNKRALEGLVLAGAMDSLAGSRAQKFLAIEEALNFGSKAREAISSQANSLFAASDEDFKIVEPELPDIPPWDDKEKLTRERQALGFYLSDHPLRKFEIEYNSFATVHLGEQETFSETNRVVACGVVTDFRTKIDKSGNTMAFFKLDDLSGSCECLMFSKIYSDCKDHIENESPILVKARPESSGDTIKLHIEEAIPLEEAKIKLTKNIVFCLDEKNHSEEMIKPLADIIHKYEGNTPLFLSLKQKDSRERKFRLNGYKVKLSHEFINETLKLLGEDAIRYHSG